MSGCLRKMNYEGGGSSCGLSLGTVYPSIFQWEWGKG